MKKRIVEILVWAPVIVFAATLLAIVVSLVAALLMQADHPWIILGIGAFAAWFFIALMVLIERNYRNNPDG